MTKKIVSIVLAVCLVFSCFTALGISVSAAEDTKTMYVGVISYFNDKNADTYKLHYWGGDVTASDASLTALNTTASVSVGNDFWNNQAQTFTMFKATVPAAATGFAVHAGDTWYNSGGNDGNAATQNAAYIFEYGDVNRTFYGTYTEAQEPSGSSEPSESQYYQVAVDLANAPATTGGRWVVYSWDDNGSGFSILYNARASVRKNFLVVHSTTDSVPPSTWDDTFKFDKQTVDVEATEGAYYYVTNEQILEDGNADYGKYKVSTAAPATDPAGTTSPATEPVETDLENGFYLIGVNGWTVSDLTAADKFTANEAAEGEYYLDTTLTEGDSIKVVKVENDAITAWYPDGTDNDYAVDAAHAGTVTIYFQKTYKSDWSDFGGYFYIAASTTPTNPTNPSDPTDPTPDTEDGYYLFGDMNSWKADADYKFTQNPSNTKEYVLETTLSVGEKLKVVDVQGTKTTYYPGGTDNDYVVDAAHAGKVTIYFNPEKNSAWTLLEGYIFIAASTTPTDPTNPTDPSDPTDPTPDTEDGYYLFGDMNSWKADADYKFTKNPSNDKEYVLETTLSAGQKLKVVDVQGTKTTYYPGGSDNDYVVDAAHAGKVTIYFNPEKNSAWTLLEGYIYIEAGETPENPIPEPDEGNIIVLVSVPASIGWGNVYAHAWGSKPYAEWAAASTKMTYAYKDADNYSVYYIQLPDDCSGMVFHNGTDKTVDIDSGVSNGAHWKINPNNPGSGEHNEKVYQVEFVEDAGGYAYFVAGSMNEGEIANMTAAHKFAEDPDHPGEYILVINVAEGNWLKVVKVKVDANGNATGTSPIEWYPGGSDNDYIVSAAVAGEVTIHFNPNKNTSWTDLDGYAKIEKNAVVPVEPDTYNIQVILSDVSDLGGYWHVWTWADGQDGEWRPLGQYGYASVYENFLLVNVADDTDMSWDIALAQTVNVTAEDGTTYYVLSETVTAAGDDNGKHLVSTTAPEEPVEPQYNADLKASLTSLAFNTGIAVYMQVNKTVLNGYTDPYMVFTYVDYFGNNVEKIVTEYEDGGTTYNFRIDGILPQMMTTEISGVLHAAKDGVEYYGDARVDTIHDYIGRGLAAIANNSRYANLRTLLIDLANYGAEVQKYLNYKTDHLANEGFDAYQQYATATVAPEYQRDFAYAPAEAADGTAWKTTSLALGDVIKTNAYFTTNSITGKTVKVAYYNAKGEAVEKIFTNDEIQHDANGYYVTFAGLFPQQMDEPAYFTVYNADGKSCSPTMKYTINSYMNKAIAGTTGQLHNLLVATAKYGVSTQKYANYQVKG